MLDVIIYWACVLLIAAALILIVSVMLVSMAVGATLLWMEFRDKKSRPTT